MIVCQCHGVSDRRIRAAAMTGAETSEDVGRACAAGTDCGACRPIIEDLLDECPAPLRLRCAS